MYRRWLQYASSPVCTLGSPPPPPPPDDARKQANLQLLAGFLRLLGPRVHQLTCSHSHLSHITLALVEVWLPCWLFDIIRLPIHFLLIHHTPSPTQSAPSHTPLLHNLPTPSRVPYTPLPYTPLPYTHPYTTYTPSSTHPSPTHPPLHLHTPPLYTPPLHNPPLHTPYTPLPYTPLLQTLQLDLVDHRILECSTAPVTPSMLDSWTVPLRFQHFRSEAVEKSVYSVCRLLGAQGKMGEGPKVTWGRGSR